MELPITEIASLEADLAAAEEENATGKKKQ
jgi:hypothetical protein